MLVERNGPGLAAPCIQRRNGAQQEQQHGYHQAMGNTAGRDKMDDDRGYMAGWGILGEAFILQWTG